MALAGLLGIAAYFFKYNLHVIALKVRCLCGILYRSCVIGFQLLTGFLRYRAFTAIVYPSLDFGVAVATFRRLR